MPPARAALLVLVPSLVFGPNGVLRAQPAELQLVASNSVPQSGTFWSIQLTNLPPLPWNPFPQLAVYTFGDTPGVYWVDDQAVDYAVVQQQREAARVLRQAASRYAEESLAELPPEPDTWIGLGGEEESSSPYGEPVYASGQGLCLLPPQLQGTNVVLTVTNGSGGAPYDLYATTNLSPNVPGLNLTNWLWLGRLSPDQTVVTVPQLSEEQGYYRLGTTNDADGDGLPDAYENLVTHTAPNVYGLVSNDGQGTPDGWYLEQGLNPLGSGVATQDGDADGLLNWQEYRYGSDPQVAESFGVWVGSPSGALGIP